MGTTHPHAFGSQAHRRRQVGTTHPSAHGMPSTQEHRIQHCGPPAVSICTWHAHRAQLCWAHLKDAELERRHRMVAARVLLAVWDLLVGSAGKRRGGSQRRAEFCRPAAAARQQCGVWAAVWCVRARVDSSNGSHSGFMTVQPAACAQVGHGSSRSFEGVVGSGRCTAHRQHVGSRRAHTHMPAQASCPGGQATAQLQSRRCSRAWIGSYNIAQQYIQQQQQQQHLQHSSSSPGCPFGMPAGQSPRRLFWCPHPAPQPSCS